MGSLANVDLVSLLGWSGVAAGLVLMALWKRLRQGVLSTRDSFPVEYDLQPGLVRYAFSLLLKKETWVVLLLIILFEIISPLYIGSLGKMLVLFHRAVIAPVLAGSMILVFLSIRNWQKVISVWKVRPFHKIVGFVTLFVAMAFIISCLSTLLVIPGVMIGLALLPVVAIYVEHELSWTKAIEESIRRVNGHKWEILIMLVIMVIVIYTVVLGPVALVYQLTSLKTMTNGFFQMQNFYGLLQRILAKVVPVMISLAVYDKLVPKK